MPERIAGIVTAIEEVTAVLRALDKTVHIHEHTLRLVKALSAALLIAIILALFLLYRQDRLQREVRTESDTTRTALCAEISLFLQFESRTTSNPTYTPAQVAQQLGAYKILRQIQADLECTTR